MQNISLSLKCKQAQLTYERSTAKTSESTIYHSGLQTCNCTGICQ